MGKKAEGGKQSGKRGAAHEERDATPPTPAEMEASRQRPSVPRIARTDSATEDSAGVAGGASGSTGGGSGTPGHPDSQS
jgi:hypothetical protein